MTPKPLTAAPAGLVVMLAVASFVVVLGECAARGIVDAPPGSGRLDGSKRQDNVHVLPHEPDDVPAWLGAPRHALLIGNSHTYALPGLSAGRPLRPDPGSTLVDRMAAHAPAGAGAHFDRLAYPNFLPFEMLTRVGQLDLLGYRPRLVIIGVTWRNLARDSALRHQIQRVYREPARAQALRALLASREVAAAPGVLAAVDEELRAAADEAERERTRSLADRFDERASRWVGERVTARRARGSARPGAAPGLAHPRRLRDAAHSARAAHDAGRVT